MNVAPIEQYADRPTVGFDLLDFRSPAKMGDMAYDAHICEWEMVELGQNIVGVSACDLWDFGIMAVARRIQ